MEKTREAKDETDPGKKCKTWVQEKEADANDKEELKSDKSDKADFVRIGPG